jgi:hypothetical protein
MLDDAEARAAPSRRKTARAHAEAVKVPGSSPPPCCGCKYEQRCKTESICCDAYVIFKRIGASPERLAYAPRQPSAAIFERANAPFKRRASAVFRRPLDEVEVG